MKRSHCSLFSVSSFISNIIDLSTNPAFIYSGELNTLEKISQSIDAKNPFHAQINVMKNLNRGRDRVSLHLEIDLGDSEIIYETGDHVAIFPQNSSEEVERLGHLLHLSSLDTLFTMTNIDVLSSKKHLFPCPCSFRTALTYYIDMKSPPRMNLIKFLADHTADPIERNILLELASPNNKNRYQEYILSDRRSISDILSDFPSCTPPVFNLFELLPRIQCRYYSIASSPKV
jgi:NADPH-ferrihemoprotein reductase